MGNRIEQISVPDIGGAEDIDVIEILVKPGDRIEAEAPLITLEGDKATMDVPAPMGGVVKALNIKVGDKVAEGSVILTLEVADGADDKAPAEPKPEPKSESKPAPAPEPKAEAKSAPAPTAASSIIEVKIPDIGGAADVDVIEVSVKAGDKIEVEDALIGIDTYQKEFEIRKKQLQLSQEALNLSWVRYNEGVTSFLEFINLQTSLFSSQLNASESYKLHLQSIVKLYLALGGGW